MSHRYYSLYARYHWGTFPKPQGKRDFAYRKEILRNGRTVPEIARQAWGYIEYKGSRLQK